MLISNNIFKSKERLYMNSSALVSRNLFLLIKMVTCSSLKINIHSSGEFCNSLQFINGQKFDIPFLIENEELKIIKEARNKALWEKEKSIEIG